MVLALVGDDLESRHMIRGGDPTAKANARG
jgi:hypothetical protein